MKRRSTTVLLLAAAAGGVFSFYPLVPLPRGYSPLPLISKGLHYYAEDDYRRAIHYQRLALAVDSTFPEANLNLGACFFKMGLTDSARYYFEREKQFNPERPKAYTDLASLDLVSRRYEQAITEADQALIRRPYDVKAYRVFLRAASAVQQINNDSLAGLVSRAAESTGDDIYLLNDAASLLTARGNLSAAESMLLRALTTKPPAIETDDEAFTPTFRNSPLKWKGQRAQTNFQLGYIYGLQGNYNEAIRRSSLAIETDSSISEAYVNLISGLLSIGERQQAQAVLATALDRFPTSTRLHQLQRLLRR